MKHIFENKNTKIKFDNTIRSTEFVWDFREILISKMRPLKLLSTFLWLLISFLGCLKGEIYDFSFNYVITTPFEIFVIIMTSIKFHFFIFRLELKMRWIIKLDRLCRLYQATYFRLKLDLTILYAFVGNPTLQPDCVTPSNLLGRCVEVRYCVSVMTALKNNDHRTNPKVSQYLRESQCGKVKSRSESKILFIWMIQKDFNVDHIEYVVM